MAVGPMLAKVLKDYGLESLTSWASNAIINGWSEDQVLLEMYGRQEFKTRFAGMFMLESKGQPPISIDEYLAYEKTVHNLAAMWGTTLTKEEVDKMIGNSLSPVEVERRFDIAAAAIYESDIETRTELERMFNVNLGQQMKYWMNPTAELGVLEQQYRMAEVAGAALRTGYEQLTSDQAKRLTEAGVTREQAVTGFGQLVGMQPLFTPMDIGEGAITQDQQVALLAGDADVEELIKNRVERRQAEFGGSGSYGVGEQGFATGTAD